MNRHWPLIINIGLLLGIVFIVSQRMYHDHEGVIIYALDDAYIHMAMARNFAQHGVWGPTKYEFGNASSSPGWTLLLSAGYAIWDDPRTLPLILNIICGLLFLCLGHLILLRTGIRPGLSALVQGLIILCIPLPALIFTGMEHTLHLLVNTAFVYCIAITLATPGASRWTFPVTLGLASILILVRFEGIFAVIVAAGLLAFLGRRKHALGVLFAGMLPVIIFGMISVLHGADFLPNSVLVKGTPDFHSFMGWAEALGKGCWFLVNTEGLAVPVLMVLLLLACDIRFDRSSFSLGNLMALQFIILMALHIQLAKTGWFYRYEAYLMGMGFLTIAIYFKEQLAAGIITWPGNKIRSIAAALLIFVMIAPLGLRAKSLAEIEQASRDIYRQHYQMAMFLQRYYNERTLALNDIGAVCYFTDIRIVDLWGLATNEVARLKRAGKFNKEAIRRICKDAKVDLAMVYPTWFSEYGNLPEEWLMVGEMTKKENIIAGSSRVGIYAFTPSQALLARQNLTAYSREMPPDTEIKVIKPQ